MKKIAVFTSCLLCSSIFGFSQVYQTTIHTTALRLQAQNAAMKIAKTNAYREMIEDVEEAKTDMLKAKVAIEEVHRLTFKALTDVHDGIKEAKKFYYTLQAIKRIQENLMIAGRISSGIKIIDRWEKEWFEEVDENGHFTGGYIELNTLPIYKNPILPLHVRYNKLISERIINLVSFINQFIRTEDKGTANRKPAKIISNIVRERFLSDVYQKVYTIEIITKSYLYGIRTVKWQVDANNILPYQMWINDDKILLNRIKSKIKF